MPKMIFINLPVADLPKAIAFYEVMGATNDARFTDETAAMMMFSDTISVMLLTHDRFKGFAPGRTIAPRGSVEALFCLTADSRADVDAIVERAGPAGGTVDVSPVDDYGFMYGRSFEDLDGHLWGVNWMDVDAAMAAGMGSAETVDA